MATIGGLSRVKIDGIYSLQVESFRAQVSRSVAGHHTGDGIVNAAGLDVPQVTLTRAILLDAPQGETIASLTAGKRTIEIIDFSTGEFIWGLRGGTRQNANISGTQQSAQMTGDITFLGEQLIAGSKV